MLTDLGLETIKYSRDFHKLKWHLKNKYMNDRTMVFKLLTNEWDKVKSKVAPENVGLPMLILSGKN